MLLPASWAEGGRVSVACGFATRSPLEETRFSQPPVPYLGNNILDTVDGCYHIDRYENRTPPPNPKPSSRQSAISPTRISRFARWSNCAGLVACIALPAGGPICASLRPAGFGSARRSTRSASSRPRSEPSSRIARSTRQVVCRYLDGRELQERDQQLRDAPGTWGHSENRMVHGSPYPAGDEDRLVPENERRG